MSFGDIFVTEDGDDSIQILGSIIIQGVLSVSDSNSDSIQILGKVIIQGNISASEIGNDSTTIWGKTINRIRTPADLVTKVFKEIKIIDTISTYQ